MTSATGAAETRIALADGGRRERRLWITDTSGGDSVQEQAWREGGRSRRARGRPSSETLR